MIHNDFSSVFVKSLHFTNIYYQSTFIGFVLLRISVSSESTDLCLDHFNLMIQLDKHIMWWVSNWFSGQAQRVTLNAVTSDWSPVTSGILHGSALGLVVFNIFINNLDAGREGILTMFANDRMRKLLDPLMAGRPAVIPRQMRELDNQQPHEAQQEKCQILHQGWANLGSTKRFRNVMLESRKRPEGESWTWFSSSLAVRRAWGALDTAWPARAAVTAHGRATLSW